MSESSSNVCKGNGQDTVSDSMGLKHMGLVGAGGIKDESPMRGEAAQESTEGDRKVLN